MVAAETGLLLEQEKRDIRPAHRQGEGGKAASQAAARDHHGCGVSFITTTRCLLGPGSQYGL
jgi:hypothetical protein